MKDEKPLKQLIQDFACQLGELGVETLYYRLPSAAELAQMRKPPAVKTGTGKPKNEMIQKLAELEARVKPCTLCKLSKTRTQTVFGVGDPAADLVFVGEAPGYDEDQQGIPFVGKAGQLLTKIIEAMQLSREQVYICNVIKCRPPENRDPEPEEIATCIPYLEEQLSILQPKVICTLGRHSAHHLLKINTPITKLRGQWHEYKGIPVMPTFHPAYLLRNPSEKAAVWEDVQKIMKLLGIPIPKR